MARALAKGGGQLGAARPCATKMRLLRRHPELLGEHMAGERHAGEGFPPAGTRTRVVQTRFKGIGITRYMRPRMKGSPRLAERRVDQSRRYQSRVITTRVFTV